MATTNLKVLVVDAGTAYYRVSRYPLGAFYGPVDLGLHLAVRHDSLNMGSGLLAGSIFPGSNRLVLTGFSPCWHGFYISSMGGAALVFDNLGINMLSVVGRAPTPSILYLNRTHGEDIEVEVVPVDAARVWQEGRGGVYGLLDHALERFGDRYAEDPRVLAVGPAALATDFGAIVSAPVRRGAHTHVDTWAGRGGFGTKLLRDHGLAAVIYGGTAVDEDFRDRKVADAWFQDRYQQKLAAKDLEVTTKYRFDPRFETGGTFGVNFATLGGEMLSFNYRSLDWEEGERVALHERFVRDHYLKQFNEETIKPKQQKNCGEPCAAVCKKMHGEYKKDYEPYQALGPLCGVFDQRAAERLVGRADALGFDAISAGGVVAWLLECLDTGALSPADLGVKDRPVFSPDGFDVVGDSAHNAALGIALLDAAVERRGVLDLSRGARRLARRLARERGRQVLDPLVYVAHDRRGWMVPNQYWRAGVLSPMPIMGKYYMHYGSEFVPPRELGRKNAARMQRELLLDTLGLCRFHRGWAEEMVPEIVEAVFGIKADELREGVRMTAVRINSRNASGLWESGRTVTLLRSFLRRRREVAGDASPELAEWLERFDQGEDEAALAFWYEVHKGTQESLREL